VSGRFEGHPSAGQACGRWAPRAFLACDLYDGVQQQIVSLLAKLRLARNQLHRHPRLAEATLAELRTEADGVGFVPADAAGSGLVGLRDRVEAVGGRLRVTSGQGEEPTVTARLPALGREVSRV
jgi:signal transduction histidine kinase